MAGGLLTGHPECSAVDSLGRVKPCRKHTTSVIACCGVGKAGGKELGVYHDLVCVFAKNSLLAALLSLDLT